MGTKTVLNEFIAYVDLAHLPPAALSPRSRLILTYAMCGFANFGSLGIMIGGMGAMVPERKHEIVGARPALDPLRHDRHLHERRGRRDAVAALPGYGALAFGAGFPAKCAAFSTGACPMNLSFAGETRAGRIELEARIDALVIAGWTGRDAAAVEAHIAELEHLGVKRPRTTPIFYRVAAALLTTAPSIEVAGGDSSGEVEPVLVSLADRLWVGVGSDHTDRKLEATGVTLAKQVCAKPLAPALWPFEEVADHWDALVLRAHAVIAGSRRLYQEGPVARLRPPPELIRLYRGGVPSLQPGTAMFCGTLAVAGAIAAAEQFELELEDPVLGRRIAHSYAVHSLPVMG